MSLAVQWILLSVAVKEHWPATLREFVLTARSLVIPREQKAPQSVGCAPLAVMLLGFSVQTNSLHQISFS